MSYSDLTSEVFIDFLISLGFVKSELIDSITLSFADPRSGMKIRFDKNIKILPFKFFSDRIKDLIGCGFQDEEIREKLEKSKQKHQK